MAPLLKRCQSRCLLTFVLAGIALPVSPLIGDALESMVIVEGDRGRASGFLVTVEGRLQVITNAHVIKGNRKLSFKTLDNRELSLGPLQIADSMDLVRAELKGKATALSMLQQVEQKLRIGDEVIVAGNAEGEGVVREIPGKVVGIGPDRIEVDASFVPGNSGSPILLKSTSEVIGVATYLKIPLFYRRSQRSEAKDGEPVVTCLNEVRRFGYRLDTVARWITPKAADGLFQEGLRLEDLEELDSTIAELVRAGTAAMVKLGSAGFIPEKRKTQPQFALLAKAVDEFACRYQASQGPEGRKGPFLELFDHFKSLTTSDPAKAGQGGFTGYFATLFAERLKWREGLHEWLDFTSHQAEKNSWVLEAPWWEELAPSVDPSKLHLTLEHQEDWSATPDKRHRISIQESSRPRSLRNIVWVVESPNEKMEEVEMNFTRLRVTTPVNGTYRVHAEFHGSGSSLTISNQVEFTVTDIPQPNVEINFAREKPLPISSDEVNRDPDWEELGKRVASERYAKTPIVGHDSISKVIKDLPGDGAVLIGFECIIAPFRTSKETVRGLRPVYLTRNGQRTGNLWGGARGNTIFRLIANPGYAVGKVSGQFDRVALRRIKVRFDRICGLKLNPKDSYETDWIGAYENADEACTDTNGRLPIGLSGESGGGLDGIRLVCLTGENAPSSPALPLRIPSTFSSLEQVLDLLPQGPIATLSDSAKREEALAEINRFLTANVKGKILETRVTVEMATAIGPGSRNSFRIKAPDAHVEPNDPIRTRFWAYFTKADAPKTAPAIGSSLTISGRFGRCEVTESHGFVLNVDLQDSKQVMDQDVKVPQMSQQTERQKDN